MSEDISSDQFIVFAEYELLDSKNTRIQRKHCTVQREENQTN